MTDVQWSVVLTDADTGVEIRSYQSDLVMRTASIGKLLLLATTARLIVTGRLSPAERLRRTAADAVADSGVWQHLVACTRSNLAVRGAIFAAAGVGDVANPTTGFTSAAALAAANLITAHRQPSSGAGH